MSWAHIYIYIYIYMCMCVCVCIWGSFSQYSLLWIYSTKKSLFQLYFQFSVCSFLRAEMFILGLYIVIKFPIFFFLVRNSFILFEIYLIITSLALQLKNMRNFYSLLNVVSLFSFFFSIFFFLGLGFRHAIITYQSRLILNRNKYK